MRRILELGFGTRGRARNNDYPPWSGWLYGVLRNVLRMPGHQTFRNEMGYATDSLAPPLDPEYWRLLGSTRPNKDAPCMCRWCVSHDVPGQLLACGAGRYAGTSTTVYKRAGMIRRG